MPGTRHRKAWQPVARLVGGESAQHSLLHGRQPAVGWREPPFKGYRVTCFTNEEEEADGLASRCQWLLEDELKEEVGVEFSRGPIWEPYTVEDRNLLTGQNPDSAAVLAEWLLKILA
jgi:putative intracellular protease/amidase